MDRKVWIAAAALISLVGCANTGLIYIAECDLTRTKRLPCTDLPSTSDVRKAMSEHSSVVLDIVEVNPSFVSVQQRQVSDCPGKAVIAVEHSTLDECKQIRKIVGEDFFGIPYGLINM